MDAISPPYRELTAEAIESHAQELAGSKAKIVLVALGCPKQERWMAERKPQLQTVMIGIGAALDFHAGRVPRAPRWMQKSGLEWFFRLMMEPRRLWRRYLIHNPRFILLLLAQWLHVRRFDAHRHVETGTGAPNGGPQRGSQLPDGQIESQQLKRNP